MTYRHSTNLRVPIEPVDMELLAILSDYKFGPPVPAHCGTALALESLRSAGIVGLYTTEEALSEPAVKKRTGWCQPEAVLGREWKAI